MSNFKKRILIDLDGVLNEYYGKYNEKYIPKIKIGAKEFLEKLYKKYDLYLFISRNLLLSSKWLIENKIDKYFCDVTNNKLPSYLIIDDRAIKFEDNFIEIIDKLSY